MTIKSDNFVLFIILDYISNRKNTYFPPCVDSSSLIAVNAFRLLSFDALEPLVTKCEYISACFSRYCRRLTGPSFNSPFVSSIYANYDK